MASIYDAQVGVAEETTWGTFQTPDTFIEFLSESLQRNAERVSSEGLGYGARVLRATAYEEGRIGCEGDLEVEVPDRGFALFAKHMLGKLTSSQPDVTNAPTVWEHVAEFDVIDGKSLTVQVGRPDSHGIVQPFAYVGAKITEWELTNEVDGLLTCSMTLDAKDEDQTQPLAAKSFPAGARKLSWVGGLVTLDGATARVKSVSLSGSNGLRTDRYYIQGDGSQMKDEQLEGDGLKEYEGSLASEWGDAPGMYEAFLSGAPVALTAKWEGRTIEDAFKYAFEVTIPAVRIDGETPNVGGAEAIEQSIPFTVLWNEVDSPVTIKITDDQAGA